MSSVSFRGKDRERATCDTCGYVNPPGASAWDKQFVQDYVEGPTGKPVVVGWFCSQECASKGAA